MVTKLKYLIGALQSTWIMTQKLVPKQDLLKEKKWDIIQWPSESPDLNLIEHNEETQQLAISMGSRCQAITDAK